jgi:hypothetical protein
MPVESKLPGYSWFSFLKNAAVRTGIYAGLCLSIIFTAWILIANRVPFLEPLRTQRNIAAAILMLFFACVPLIRFYRSPGELLVSSLLCWGMLTFTYEIFCLEFVFLEQRYSAFHVFVLGAISYLLFATLSWIGTIIWRVRAADNSHSQH